MPCEPQMQSCVRTATKGVGVQPRGRLTSGVSGERSAAERVHWTPGLGFGQGESHWNVDDAVDRSFGAGVHEPQAPIDGLGIQRRVDSDSSQVRLPGTTLDHCPAEELARDPAALEGDEEECEMRAAANLQDADELAVVHSDDKNLLWS